MSTIYTENIVRKSIINSSKNSILRLQVLHINVLFNVYNANYIVNIGTFNLGTFINTKIS